MPHFVVKKIQHALNDHSKPLRGAHVHVCGVAYKRNIDDVRESPALDVIHLLQLQGAHVTYTDPYVPSVRLDGLTLQSQEEGTAAAADCVVIITDHKDFDYPALVRNARLIVDTRNALRAFDSSNIVRL
jgi:UDP-N-acetyl-D-glucosamine dehydrogenase